MIFLRIDDLETQLKIIKIIGLDQNMKIFSRISQTNHKMKKQHSLLSH